MKLNAKEPARLRFKPLKNGGSSIYLDIYCNGRRKYEFLKLYLIPERTREDKARNAETLRVANAVKAKHVIDIQCGRYDFTGGRKRHTRLLDYYDKLTEERAARTRKVWESARRHLLIYEPETDITFARIDKEWAKGLIRYLRNDAGICTNTAMNYLMKISCCFNNAVKDGIIDKSPFAGLERIKPQESKREYLTVHTYHVVPLIAVSVAFIPLAFPAELLHVSPV